MTTGHARNSVHPFLYKKQPYVASRTFVGMDPILAMNTFLLWLAALVSFVTFMVHTFIGGPRVAKPLLATTHLPVASKWLNYYCWHIATILLLAMSVGFSYVALRPDRPELAIFLFTLSAALSALSAAVALKGGINPLRFPSTSLFAAIAALGASALLS